MRVDQLHAELRAHKVWYLGLLTKEESILFGSTMQLHMHVTHLCHLQVVKVCANQIYVVVGVGQLCW